MWLVLSGEFGIEEQEFRCEQAIAHLDECCPRFEKEAYRCSASGCDSHGRADLTVEAAQCIIGARCDTLVANRVCDAPTRAVCE